jgi:hypothetical protein
MKLLVGFSPRMDRESPALDAVNVYGCPLLDDRECRHHCSHARDVAVSSCQHATAPLRLSECSASQMAARCVNPNEIEALASTEHMHRSVWGPQVAASGKARMPRFGGWLEAHGATLIPTTFG